MPVVVFCMFFTSQEINIKRSPNTAKLFVDIFMDQKTSSGPEKHLGGASRGAQPTRARQAPLVRPGGLCHPRVTPIVLLWPMLLPLLHKTSAKSYAVFGLRLVMIFCEVKNKQNTTTGTGHYVNRLVPKNDIKLLLKGCKHPRMII